ncbi:helix-turn-helix domain-containing protein [Photobacterium atrarenae]|uniref:Cro/Cl family transcriptional regulator n=1 Tax=Photobacterium atrarenae TaxID=865757 RepID=A0ABY5GBG4_9GAMM|nr:LexA family transcriptional regulator [Photobacterium atrarenae]UTV26414.1 Cro/Cl family transcriptional regulator [Photobacterium atrarenae]
MNGKSESQLFSERLNKACDQAGFPVRGRAKEIQEKLEEKVSVVAIRKWLNGEAIPDTKRMRNLAKIVGTSVDHLITGESDKTKVELAGSVNKVPVLSWVQAGVWTESPSAETLGDIINWQETTAKVTSKAFALRVRGDSMTNPHGYPSIPDGSIVIVESCPDPENGKIVVAMLSDSEEATLKKLQKDGPFKHLIPLNPKYEPIPINGNCRIVGYVKQVIMDL